MRIKSLISNLLDLSKSASFLLVVVLSFAMSNQSMANQNNTSVEFLFDGPPTTNNGGIGTGK